MKGFLKSNEGIYQLAPKVTTIGREGCDLIIQNNRVDFQHAVIEYSENEDCFVLQDLNTAQGTYVNDCRLQNAAVRLAPGDIIRFGTTGTTYELTVDNEAQLSYPPVHQRPAWTQPLSVITDPVPPQVVIHEGFPQLRSIVATTTTNWCNSPQKENTRPPTAATLRTRPLSAGTVRTGLQRSQTAQPVLNSKSRCHGGSSSSGIQGGIDLVALQEKEQRILRLQEECKRLSFFESECLRKDEGIMQLREEISDLQAKIRGFETGQVGSHLCGDAQVPQRIMLLESELQQRNMEIQALKNEITKMTEQELRPSSSNVRQDINDRIMEINSLKTELQRTKKKKVPTATLR